MAVRLVYGRFVHRAIVLFSIQSLLSLTLPPFAFGQPGAWGEPIAPAEPEPPPAPRSEPAPTPQPAEPAPNKANPDWIESPEPPPLRPSKPSASESYGIVYASRSLTMPRGMMRGTYDTVVGRRTGDTVSAMSFGAAITLADDFEIGFSRYRMGSYPSIDLLPDFGFGGEGLIAFSMSPDAEFGDIPLYGRFEAFESDVVKLGIDAVFRIPTSTEFGFLGGMPLRFVIQEQFAVDTGLSFTVNYNPQGPALWTLDFPLKLVANATDRFFLELMSGMSFFDLSHTIDTVTSGLVRGPFYFIPLGLGSGYSVKARGTMIDILAHFQFPTFYGFTSRDSELTTDIWQIIVGLNVYSPVLFKGSAL
jgi:hypothetical protein